MPQREWKRSPQPLYGNDNRFSFGVLSPDCIPGTVLGAPVSLSTSVLMTTWKGWYHNLARNHLFFLCWIIYTNMMHILLILKTRKKPLYLHLTLFPNPLPI